MHAAKGDLTIMQENKIDTKGVRKRSELHIARKVYHVAGIALILFLYQNLTYSQSIQALAIASVVILSADMLRLKSRRVKKTATEMLSKIIRKEELRTLSSMTFLVLGTFVVVAFFPKPVGMLALIHLGVGDPASSIVGVLKGKDVLIGRKTLQGAIAGFVACAAASLIYFTLTGIMTERLIVVSLLAGLIGAISELIPIGRFDDNFSFPILSAIMLWGLFNLFGGFA